MGIVSGTYKKYRHDSLYRNSIYLMASTLILAVLGFFFWVINARIYTTEQIGIATTIISICSLITNFSILGLRTTIIRYLPTSKQKNAKINTSINLIALASLFSAIIFLFGIPFFSPVLIFIQRNIIFSLLFIISIIFSSLSQFLEGVFIAYRSSGYVFLKNAIWSVCKLIFPFLLLFLGSYGIFLSFSFANILAVIICLFVLGYKFKYSYKPSINIRIIRLVAKLSFGNYLSGFFSIFPSLLLPLIITNNIGPKESAFFYIDMMIANLLYIIPLATTQSLFAELSYDKNSLREHLKKATILISLLMGIGIFTTIFFGNIILQVFGKSYSDSGFHFLQLLALSGIFIAINCIGSTILNVKKKIKLLVVTNMLTAALIIIFSLLFIRFGLTGIGFAWMLGQGISSIANILVIRVLLY